MRVKSCEMPSCVKWRRCVELRVRPLPLALYIHISTLSRTETHACTAPLRFETTTTFLTTRNHPFVDCLAIPITMSDSDLFNVPTVPEQDQSGGDGLPTYDDLAQQHGPNSR